MSRFPFVLGTDIVNIKRWNITENPVRITKLAQRFMHKSEQEHLRVSKPRIFRLIFPHLLAEVQDSREDYKTGNYLANMTTVECRAASQFLAGRWAAKEAAKKAWGADLIGLKDVRVLVPGDTEASAKEQNDSQHQGPYIVCTPSLGVEDGPEDPNLRHSGLLSISHDGDYAIATVIGEALPADLLKYFQERNKAAKAYLKAPPVIVKAALPVTRYSLQTGPIVRTVVPDTTNNVRISRVKSSLPSDLTKPDRHPQGQSTASTKS